MTSVSRVLNVLCKDGKFDNISTPSYDDAVGDVPIPFTVTNGVLDIAITNPRVESLRNMGTNPRTDIRFQAKQMGGRALITSFGPSMLIYLQRLIQNLDSLPSLYLGEIAIVTNPVMTKIQLAQPLQVQGLESERVYGVNNYPPSSDEYVGGNVSNSYYTSWVFL